MGSAMIALLTFRFQDHSWLWSEPKGAKVLELVADTSSSPLVTDWLTAGANIVVAISIAIGGLLAYRNFLRSRFRPRCTLSLRAELLSLEPRPGIRIDIGIRNSGQAPLMLRGEDQQVRLTPLDDIIWREAVAFDDGVVLWTEGEHRLVNVMTNYAGRSIGDLFLEPDDEMRRTIFFPAPPGDWRCLLVELSVQARYRRRGMPVTWKADRIVFREDDDRRKRRKLRGSIVRGRWPGKPAASSSRSQVQAGAASAAAYLAWDRPSVGVRWRPWLSLAIVIHFVTRPLASRP